MNDAEGSSTTARAARAAALVSDHRECRLCKELRELQAERGIDAKQLLDDLELGRVRRFGEERLVVVARLYPLEEARDGAAALKRQPQRQDLEGEHADRPAIRRGAVRLVLR